MFSFLKNSPTKKLKKQYALVLEQAMSAQRKGDIRLYSELTNKAQNILDEITELESNLKNSND